MRKLLSILSVLLITYSLFTSIAEAGRFGGGRSFGASHSYSSFSRGSYGSRSAYGSPNQGRGLGGGIIGGMILGGLVTSLFMGHGVGTGIFTWVMVFAGIYLLFNLLQGKSAVRGYHFPGAQTGFRPQASVFQSGNTLNVKEEDFLRAAKILFMRLQAANDSKNMDDIIHFTTPEVAAEVQMQLHERSDSHNVTEVVKLDSELVGVNGKELSVRFSGLIKEATHQAPAIFSEIWHFIRDTNTNKWIVSGIQQD